MKKTSPLLLLLLFISHFSFAIIETERITIKFESDTYELHEKQISDLNNFLNGLTISGDFEFHVTGHTDGDGDSEYNMDLSRKRANSILEFFNTSGINTNTTTINFKGELEPLADNYDPFEKAQNRRVDIIFKRYYFESMNELMKELKIDNCTKSWFDAAEDQTVQGKRGTILKIKKDSFIDKDGNIYRGEVELILTEALDIQKYFEEGLSTMADGQLLESGGMYKLEALDKNGAPLQLAADKAVQVAMPSNNIRSGMNVFMSEDGTDWDITEQEPLTAITDFELPKKPRMKYPAWKVPKYVKSRKYRPLKPSEPIHPKRPKLPNRSAYQAKGKWYQFKDRKKIRSQAANRYLKAIKDYEQQMEAFYLKYPEFEQECNAYSEKLDTYYEDLAKWKRNEKDKEREFYNKVKPESYKNYQRTVEQARAKHFERIEVWKKECDSIMNSYFSLIDEMGVPPSDQATRYVLQQAELGWVNIDRFYKIEGKREDLIVKNDNTNIEGRVFIHFPDISSCLNMRIDGDLAIQEGFPTTEPAKLIAYRINDGGIHWFEKDITGKKEVNLSYNTIKFAEFRKRISDLSSV